MPCFENQSPWCRILMFHNIFCILKTGATHTKMDNIKAGPIQGLYSRICAHDHNHGGPLLKKVQIQQSQLDPTKSKEFLPAMLEEIKAIAEPSSPEVQEFFRSIIAMYFRLAVGQEPKKPDNWTVQRKCTTVTARLFRVIS